MPPKAKDGTQPPQLETGCLRIGKDSSRITVSGNSFCDSYVGEGAIHRKLNDELAGGMVLEELERSLISQGHRFATETDTEVVAHLVSREVEGGKSPQDAVATVLRGHALLASFPQVDAARIGVTGAPSQAALEALDAAARIADPTGANGAALLVRPKSDDAPAFIADEAARLRASTAFSAGARALDSALAELAKIYPDYKGQGYEIAGFVWWQGHKDQNADEADDLVALALVAGTNLREVGKRGLAALSFICIPPGSAVVYRLIVYVIAYLMAGLVVARNRGR